MLFSGNEVPLWRQWWGCAPGTCSTCYCFLLNPGFSGMWVQCGDGPSCHCSRHRSPDCRHALWLLHGSCSSCSSKIHLPPATGVGVCQPSGPVHSGDPPAPQGKPLPGGILAPKEGQGISNILERSRGLSPVHPWPLPGPQNLAHAWVLQGDHLHGFRSPNWHCCSHLLAPLPNPTSHSEPGQSEGQGNRWHIWTQNAKLLIYFNSDCALPIFEQSGLVEYLLAHGRRLGTSWSLSPSQPKPF